MILLDTCVIVWDALEPARLTPAAASAIEAGDQAGKLIMVDISLWEIAMLVQKRRLCIPVSPARFVQLYLQSRNISVIAISPEIAELSVSLAPDLNQDPADRIIAATAIIHHARLLTADKNLLAANAVDTLW